MSEPSAFAAGSRAGSSQGRDGVDVMACARAGAGASSGTSGATSDSAKPSTAAAGAAVFRTPLHSSSPCAACDLARSKLDALLAGASEFVRSAGTAPPAPHRIRSTFPPVGLHTDEAYLMPDI